jgi:hypothetical protein
MRKEEKSLKEGLEKLSENQDNMSRKSDFAFWNRIGCLLSLADLKLAGFIGLL